MLDRLGEKARKLATELKAKGEKHTAADARLLAELLENPTIRSYLEQAPAEDKPDKQYFSEEQNSELDKPLRSFFRFKRRPPVPDKAPEPLSPEKQRTLSERFENWKRDRTEYFENRPKRGEVSTAGDSVRKIAEEMVNSPATRTEIGFRVYPDAHEIDRSNLKDRVKDTVEKLEQQVPKYGFRVKRQPDKRPTAKPRGVILGFEPIDDWEPPQEERSPKDGEKEKVNGRVDRFVRSWKRSHGEEVDPVKPVVPTAKRIADKPSTIPELAEEVLPNAPRRTGYRYITNAINNIDRRSKKFGIQIEREEPEVKNTGIRYKLGALPDWQESPDTTIEPTPDSKFGTRRKNTKRQRAPQIQAKETFTPKGNLMPNGQYWEFDTYEEYLQAWKDMKDEMKRY